MKILFLPFFSFALCAIQKTFPEDAFQAYSLKVETISREEFERIDEFISRVEEADDKDLVTEKDKGMLSQMGFDSFLCSLRLPQCFRSQDETDSDLTWGEINDSTRRIETSCDKDNTRIIFENGLPFAKVLRFMYSFENVDALSRDDFFRRHYLLFFLKAGKQISIIKKLKLLNEVYGSMLSNSILEFFAHKDEDFISVLFSILTPFTLSIDPKLLNYPFSLEADSFLENVIKSLTKCFELKGISKLEKIEFRPSFFYERMQPHIFQILKQNAESIISLDIFAYEFPCPEEILFPNVQRLSLRMSSLAKMKLKFLHHSNYTTLNLGTDVTFTDIIGKPYFSIVSRKENITSLISLMEDNKNLETLAWNRFDFGYDIFTAREAFQSLKSAVSSFKHLTSFEFHDIPTAFEEQFEKNPFLKSLTMNSLGLSNWKSLIEKFPNLSHFAIRSMSFEHLDDFVGLAQTSQLQFASLKFFHQSKATKIQMDLLSALSKISSLEKIDLQIPFPEQISAFELDEKFKVIDFYQNNNVKRGSNLSSLPFGPGVLYVRIQKRFSRERPFISEDLGILKEKFPNLKRLVLPYGSIVQGQPGEFDFEVQTTLSKFDELFNKFPSLTLSY